MVTLELQLPSKQKCHSASLQEVDAVAALQQLGLEKHSVRVTTRTASPKRSIIHEDPHSSPSAVQLYQNGPATTTGRHSTASKAALSIPSSGRHSIATTLRDSPHSYASDGVRLFEQGEQFLFVGSPRPPVLEGQELSFSLPAGLDASSSSDHVASPADDSQKPQRRKYVCSVKDDPLVKGRPALPDLFRQKDAFTLLQPSLGSSLSFSKLADQKEQQQQPILLQNLEAFLAEKLQMADRLQAAYGQKDRNTLAIANLALDAHRQVFEAFIHSFTTYRPLLLKVRQAFEEALQDALSSQADNIHMKAQLAALHQRKAEAVETARGSGNDAAVSGRGALYERLLEAQGRQEQAAAVAAAEEAANAAATAELRAARAEAADLKMRIVRARSSMFASSSFASELSK